MRINLAEFQKRYDLGLLRKQVILDDFYGELCIWNYTVRCSVERIWDEYTLQARGIITRPDGTVHARSFSKFFNLNEDLTIDKLPQEVPVITGKLDGYLGISYEHNGQVKVASRGIFTSEYAQYATDWLRKRVDNLDDIAPHSTSLVFEILYPEKRIVVDNSGRFGLVLLAAFDTATGIELDRQCVVDYGNRLDIPVVIQYDLLTIHSCVEFAKTVKGTVMEGWVAHYPMAGVRVKIKGEDYCRIHKIMTRLSTVSMWEIAQSAQPDVRLAELQQILPPEYYAWAVQTVEYYINQYAALVNKIAAIADLYKYGHTHLDRRGVVEHLERTHPNLWHEVLAYMDAKYGRVDASIWKRLRPVHALPIIQDGEDE